MAINQAQALANATHYTGFHDRPSVVEIRDFTDRSPFLAQWITGLGPVWEIIFEQFELKLDSATDQSNDKLRRIVVRLSQQSGQLLSVEVTTESQVTEGVRPIPRGDIAQQQLEQAGERYESLPTEPPAYTLLQALDRILVGGIGSPLQAAEIQALYVMHATHNRDAIPAWVITLNGIPPIPHKGPPGAQVPVWQRNHIRNVVDAMSGEPLFATTIPQPVSPVELVS